MCCKVNKLSIVTLMGLPGSGKSTLAGRIKRAFEDSPETVCIVLSYDDFIPLTEQSKFLEEDNLAKTLRKNWVSSVQYLASTLLDKSLNFESCGSSSEDLMDRKRFLGKIEDLLSDLRKEGGTYESGFLVVDDNNYYKSMRNDFYQVAKSLECSFCVLNVKCSLELSKRRNSRRPVEFQVTDQVIEEMFSRIEEPDPLKSACDLFCIQYPADSDDSEELDLSVKTLLQHSLLNPVIYEPPPDRSEDRRICSENEIHQADLVLRKWINSQLVVTSFTAKNSPAERKKYGQDLNAKKALVLKKLKSGEYKILARVHQDVEFSKEILSLVKTVD